MNQKGFATLEVILMIVVIGILATIAVPRFTDTTVKANTAKIQADLTTLDNAIAIYFMENGEYPKNIQTDLKNYVKDVENLNPPTGKAYIKGKQENIPSGGYGLTSEHDRATLGTNKAGDFYLPKTTNSTGGNSSGSEGQ